jgi:hypothetical protein
MVTKKVQAIVHAMAICFTPYVSMIRPNIAPPAHLQYNTTSEGGSQEMERKEHTLERAAL